MELWAKQSHITYCNKKSDEKGITLIALVVTIIIMLILASVTIGVAFGDGGLIETTEDVKENQQKAIYNSQIEIIITNWELRKAMDDNIDLEDLWDALENEGIIKDKTEDSVWFDENGNIGENGNWVIKTPEGYEIEIPVDENGNVINGGSLGGDSTGGSTGNETTGENTSGDLSEELQTGTISQVGETIWENGKATIELETSVEGVTIQYKINTEEDIWTDYTGPIGNLSNGDIIQVRITDGNNVSSGDANIVIIDEGNPQAASITPSATTGNVGDTITFTVIQTDNESGIIGTNCKWVFNTKDTPIETEESYTGGNFTISSEAQTSVTETVTVTLEAAGTYYLHVLSVDAAGNKIETMSEAITVTDTLIVSTVADLIGKSLDENTYTVDKYGNEIVVPADFTVVEHGTDGVEYTYDKENGESTNIPVVQDGIVIKNKNDGNQFVWVPVEDITNSDGSTTTITLGRYSDFTKGSYVIAQRASKTAYDSLSPINSYYFEISSDFKGGTHNSVTYGEASSYENTKAYNLEKWISTTLDNKGYYIARYEASYGDGAKALSQASKGSPSSTTGSAPTSIGQLWNYVSQKTAAEAARTMYSADIGENKESYYSDLVNSYAWDTAIVFIQAYSGNDTYADISSIYTSTTQPANTGERASVDKECNIYDMASNLSEKTTETYIYSDGTSVLPCVNRGGNCFFENLTKTRGNASESGSAVYIGFRSVLCCFSES